MNIKRICRWTVVLLLLAALPGITAVMAQGQEPAPPGVILEGNPETGLPIRPPDGSKDLPSLVEPSESQAPAASLSEVEPNNAMGQANVMSINDVMSGRITSGDTDYFKFYAAEDFTQVLIDIDAVSIGSGLNSVVTLYTSGGVLTHSNDDTDTRDSMLYFEVSRGWWYVKVNGFGTTTGNYNLIVSSPLLISAAAANLGTGYVAGIPFRSEDILAWSNLGANGEKWVLLVDGSDLGWKSLVNLTGLWGGTGITVGFASNQTLPRDGGGTFVATPWDAVMYRLNRVGGITEATCQCDVHSVFFGSNLSLSTTSEKIDALSLLSDRWYANGGDTLDLYVSTVGAASVPGPTGTTLKPADEDVYLNQMTIASNPWFYKYTFFDGSKVNGMAVEDVVAMEYDRVPSTMYLTILGTGKIAGQNVSQKDIFAVNMPAHTWGGVVWRGADHGWNYNIDAIDYPGR